MIITKMPIKEILNEYWKDHDEEIKDRLFGFVRANKKLILRIQKTNKTKDWIPCKGVRRINTSRNNFYRIYLRVRFNGDTPGYMSTTYMILNDSVSGHKVIYLMPAEFGGSLLTFTPKFFSEYNQQNGLNPKTFEEYAKILLLYQGFVFQNL